MTTEATAANGSTPADTEALDTRAVIISLTAKDLRTSVAWYRDVLGFTVDYEMERDGKPSAAAIRSGCAKIFLNQDGASACCGSWMRMAIGSASGDR